MAACIASTADAGRLPECGKIHWLETHGCMHCINDSRVYHRQVPERVEFALWRYFGLELCGKVCIEHGKQDQRPEHQTAVDNAQCWPPGLLK